MPPPRFRFFMSGAVKEQLRDVLRQAIARGQGTEAARAATKLEEGFTWLADELGESRYPLKVMGELRVVVVGPVGAVFAVNRDKLEVHVGRFRLLGIKRSHGST